MPGVDDFAVLRFRPSPSGKDAVVYWADGAGGTAQPVLAGIAVSSLASDGFSLG